jgi:hypothetical protein
MAYVGCADVVEGRKTVLQVCDWNCPMKNSRLAINMAEKIYVLKESAINSRHEFGMCCVIEDRRRDFATATARVTRRGRNRVRVG